MSMRKNQIMQNTVELLSTKGYAALTMRAVARESELTLGALQYHYPTWETLLKALADYIAHQYKRGFEDYLKEKNDETSLLHANLDFVLLDPTNDLLLGDRLFPQLWAMALVDPIMEELMSSLYDRYLLFLEECLRQEGITEPRADAIALMAMFEGSMLFVGRGMRWEEHASATVEAMRTLIDARFGAKGRDVQI